MINYSLNAGMKAGGQTIPDTHLMQGLSAETWISFLSADETNAANSMYARTISL
jgi:hypothetical protein